MQIHCQSNNKYNKCTENLSAEQGFVGIPLFLLTVGHQGQVAKGRCSGRGLGGGIKGAVILQNNGGVGIVIQLHE